ncbi:MAG: nucleotidyltransferase domain-containing protein [Opitutales bacterium]|nr:nucleotidyltransferase domain-containing protein [Opitutales bacterium]
MVYRESGPLRQQLTALLPAFFNPRKAFHHYHSMATKIADQHLTATDETAIKKLFYILRPLYACHWIERNRTMPPTLFHEMLGQGLAEDFIERWIGEVLAAKKTAAEGERIGIPSGPTAWLHEKLTRLQEVAETLPAGNRGGALEDLNALFLQTVKGS